MSKVKIVHIDRDPQVVWCTYDLDKTDLKWSNIGDVADLSVVMPFNHSEAQLNGLGIGQIIEVESMEDHLQEDHRLEYCSGATDCDAVFVREAL